MSSEGVGNLRLLTAYWIESGMHKGRVRSSLEDRVPFPDVPVACLVACL